MGKVPTRARTGDHTAEMHRSLAWTYKIVYHETNGLNLLKLVKMIDPSIPEEDIPDYSLYIPDFIDKEIIKEMINDRNNYKTKKKKNNNGIR